MSDIIDVVVKQSGSETVEQSFASLAAAAKRAQANIASLQKTLGSVGRSSAAASRVTALGQAAQTASGHVANLTSAMGALNNTKVTSNLRGVNTELDKTDRSAKTAASSITSLASAFLGFQTIKAVISSLVEAQIAMQQIHYGLIAATGSAQGASEQFDYLSQNAEKLGLNLQTSAMEYTRLAASASAMNVAVEDQQRLYTALSQASTVLHLDQQKVQFATLALTQMFSKGKIQAEELRRQLGEAIPGASVRFQKAVMEAVKGTDLARYSFEQLMKKGLLNTKQFLPQLIEALQETGRGWEDAATGMNAEINRLGTAWFKLKNDLSSGLFSDVVVATVRFLSQHMKELSGVVAGLGIAIAIAFAPAAIIQFIGYFKVLRTLLLTTIGPWGLLAAAIIGVIGYLVTMRDEIKLSSDGMGTLGDFAVAAWDGISSAIEPVIGTLWEMIKIVGDVGIAFLQLTIPVGIAFDDINTKSDDTFKDIKESNDSTWLKVLKVIARTFDAIFGMMAGLFVAWAAVLTEMWNIAKETFSNIGDAWKAVMSGDTDLANNILKRQISGVKDVFHRLGRAAGDAFDSSLEVVATTGLEATLNGWQADANRAAQSRALKGMHFFDPRLPASPSAPTVTNPSGGSGKGPKDNSAKELEELQRKLAGVIGKVDPTQAALKELADAHNILDAALKSGNKDLLDMINKMGGADNIMALLTEKHRDALKPLEALNEKYDQQLAALRAITPEQKALVVAQEASDKARKEGRDVTMQAAIAETTYRRELERTRAELVASAEAQIYKNSAAQQSRNTSAQVQGLINQRNLGNIGEGEFAVGMKQAFGIDPNAAEQYQAQQEQYAAHLQAMTELKAEYDAQAAATSGQAHEDNIKGSQATADIIQQIETQKSINTLNTISGVLGQAAQLMNSHNKKLFRMGQAAAIAKAVVDTASAVLTAGAQWGYPWAIPFQALAVAIGAAQISQIRAQQPPSYRTGGEFVVGGRGGADSQLVQFNASPGERISINTPSQANAMERMENMMREQNNGGRGRAITQNLTIIQQGKPNNQTSRQEARQVFNAGRKLVKA